MAIEIKDYNLKGITVPTVYCRVDRLWGSSKEEWTALVGVYNKTTEEIPAIEASEGIEAQDAKTVEVMNKIDEFNFNAEFVEDLRGYASLYAGLMSKYGGEEV